MWRVKGPAVFVFSDSLGETAELVGKICSRTV